MPENKRNPKKDLEAKLAIIAAREQEIKNGLENSEESIQHSLRELVALKRDVDVACRTFNNAYRKLDLLTWIIPLGSAIIYYATYFAQGLPVAASALDGLAIPIITLVALRLVAFLVKIQMSTVRESNLGNALSNVATFAGRLTTAVRAYLPFVNEYYEGKERVQNQLSFVRTLRNSLVEYGFKLGTKIDIYLDNFYSLSDSKDDWLKETSMNLSGMYGEPQQFLQLAYADYDNDDSSRKNAWLSIRNDQTAFQRFVAFLIGRNLFDVPIVYREPVDSALAYITNLLATWNDFTLSKAQTAILRSFATIDIDKEDLLRTLAANNIPIPEGERIEFSKLLPTRDSRNTLLDALERYTKVRSYVLQLFFYDFRALTLQRDEHFSELKSDNDKIAVLSNELLNRKIISTMERDSTQREEDVSNLTSYLGTVSRYDRTDIASTFSRYSRLFEYSKSILQFLKNQSICGKEADLSFESLLTHPGMRDADFLTQVQTATLLQIREFSSYKSDATEWLEPIALATMTVYLVESEDLFLRDSVCRRVAGVARAVKILYEYSWTNDDEQDKIPADKTHLDVIIGRVIDGESRNEVYLTEFSRALTEGFLYRRIKEIPDSRLRHIEKQVNSVANQIDFKARLEKHLSALTTVLASQLKTGTIMESLRMQLVGAYTITVPTGADVISAIVDDLLPETCEELTQNDQTYSGLFLKAEGGEVRVGRYTRIGVVPFRMDFKEFTNRLQNAYRIAVSKYEQSGQMKKHSIDEYVANVIRIFPTSAYFRQLAPAEEKTADDILADIIRPLMIKKFGSIRTLEILASLTTLDEDIVAMRNILASLYDTSSTIYLIARNELDGVLSTPTLSDYVRLGKIDAPLIDKFNRRKLSEVSLIVYRSGRSGSESSVKQTLEKYVAEICHAIRARPAEGEVERVSSIIFQALSDIGMILDVFAPIL